MMQLIFNVSSFCFVSRNPSALSVHDEYPDKSLQVIKSTLRLEEVLLFARFHFTAVIVIAEEKKKEKKRMGLLRWPHWFTLMIDALSIPPAIHRSDFAPLPFDALIDRLEAP